MKGLKLKPIAAILGLGMAVLPAVSHAEDIDKLIEHRKTAFQTIASITGNISSILKGEVENKDGLVPYTQALVAVTDPDIFIPIYQTDTTGKGTVKNRAAPKIWQEFDKFTKGVEDMNEGAKVVAELAANGQLTDLEPMKENVFKACGYCHRVEEFRGPKVD